MDDKDIQRMMLLFDGFRGAYGTYAKLEQRAGSNKLDQKKSTTTVRGLVDEARWEDHLTGKYSIGIIPINEHNECVWGCVDIDVYIGIDHASLAQLAEKHSFPAVVCRSKSGGAHVYLFTTDPVAAVDMRAKLQELAVVLGAGQSELFPKQNEVSYDRGDLGHWVNMPYFDTNATKRFCITSENKQLAFEQFLNYAEKRKIDADNFMLIGEPVQVDKIEDLEEGPPCLKLLASRGFPEGSRNNGLFALGVLAKKKFPDAWEAKLEDWNRRFMEPPLDGSEVTLVVRSLAKRDYEYRCRDAPINSFCDSKTCRTQRYGVGGGAAQPIITGIQVVPVEPKLFFVSLSDGGTVECTSQQLLNPRLFQQAALDQTMAVLPLVKMDDWLGQVNRAMEKKIEIAVTGDVGTRGVFLELLERFCTDKHRAQTKEEMLLGKPWYDEITGRYYFRLRDIMEFLDRMKYKDLTRTQVSRRIKEFGGEGEFFTLNGKGSNVWYVPEEKFALQTKPHELNKVIREIPI